MTKLFTGFQFVSVDAMARPGAEDVVISPVYPSEDACRSAVLFDAQGEWDEAAADGCPFNEPRPESYEQAIALRGPDYSCEIRKIRVHV